MQRLKEILRKGFRGRNRGLPGLEAPTLWEEFLRGLEEGRGRREETDSQRGWEQGRGGGTKSGMVGQYWASSPEFISCPDSEQRFPQPLTGT